MMLRCMFLVRLILPIWLSGVAIGPSPARADDPPVKVGVKAKADEKPITDDECRAVADAILQAAAAGDVAALDRQINWDVLGERVVGGIDAPEGLRRGFLQGLSQAQDQRKTFIGSIVEQVQKGGTYTLLHIHTTPPRRRILLRLTPADGGVNYHDYLLARQPDGSVRADDLYLFLAGETISRTLRRLYLLSVAQATKTRSLLDRLKGEDQSNLKAVDYFSKLNKARQAGDHAQVVALAKAAPADLRKDKSVFLARLMASQEVSDAEYQQTIQEFRAAHPTDACIDLISVDFFALKKQFPEALACIDRVDKAVGGDPYLATIRASLYLQMDNPAAARAAVQKGLDSEPTLIDGYWTLITIALKEKNHGEVLKGLRLIRDRFGINPGDLTTVPAYADFVQSADYQTWLKDPKNQPAAEEAKPPVEAPKGS